MVSPDSLAPEPSVQPPGLEELAQNALLSSEGVGKIAGREVAMGSDKAIDKIIIAHFNNHKKLVKAVEQANREDIPDNVLKILKQSESVVNEMFKRNMQKCLQLCSKEFSGLDEHNLLLSMGGKDRIQQSQVQWHLNLGLLMNVYHQTDNPDLKKQLKFLALNYLAKAAPISIKDFYLSDGYPELLENMFHLGVFTERTYHREFDLYEKFITPILDRHFAHGSLGSFVLVDTINFEELFPLFFSVIKTPKPKEGEEIAPDKISEAWAVQLKDAVIRHEAAQKERGSIFQKEGVPEMDPPLLLDLTSFLAPYMVTDKDQAKEGIFTAKKKEVGELLEKSIDTAIEKIKKDHPDMIKNAEDEQKIRVFLKANITDISRIQEKNLGIINFSNINKSAGSRFTDFINWCGIRLGGVSSREKIFDLLEMDDLFKSMSPTKESAVAYSIPGKNIEYFGAPGSKESRTPEGSPISGSLTQKALFIRLRNKFKGLEEVDAKFRAALPPEKRDLYPFNPEKNPHMAILGNATLDLIEGLLNEIDPKQWEELNKDPDTRMLVQTALTRIFNHLGDLEKAIYAGKSQKAGDSERLTDSFSEFTSSVELIHSELSALLSIVKPFDGEAFDKIFAARLEIVPKALKEHLQAGIGKSAMNIFSGILVAAAPKDQSKAFVAHGKGVYFEERHAVGKGHGLEEILKDPDGPPVDLYIGEFNHNVDIRMSHERYEAGDVIKDVEQLLKLGRAAEHMTIAIDCTIDLINSGKAKALLERFQKEVAEGKLNFVFFRSGQKFDMLGMDNYYGGNYWIVNNGDKNLWGKFNILKKEAFQTDPLSQQWFCLANKYAPQALDRYRQQIFNNARAILDAVPQELRPPHDKDRGIIIESVAKDMEAAFINIKVFHKRSPPIIYALEQELAKRFIRAGIKIHNRGSFGFAHINSNMISGEDDISLGDNRSRPVIRNLRINPGLNPKENEIIIQFIKDIPKIIESEIPRPAAKPPT